MKPFGRVALTEPGRGELEAVARNKAAEKLERTGRLTVNPRVYFATDGIELGLRHEFELRLR